MPTPSDIARKRVHPIEERSTTPGLNGVMVVRGGLTFRELASIEIASRLSGRMPDNVVAPCAVKLADLLAIELAKTPSL